MKLEEYLRSQYYNYIRPLFIKNECDICNIIDSLELHHIPQFSELLKETLDILNLNYKQDAESYTKEELTKINLILLGLQVKCQYLTLCEPCHNNIHKNDLLFTFSNRIKINPEAYKNFKYIVPCEYINTRLDNNAKMTIVSDVAEKHNYPLRLLSWQKVKEILVYNNYNVTVTSKGTFINKEKYIKEHINKIENNIKNINTYMINILDKPLDKNMKIDLINFINVRDNGRIQKSYSKINEWLYKNNIPFIINTKRITNENKKETYWIINNIKQ